MYLGRIVEQGDGGRRDRAAHATPTRRRSSTAIPVPDRRRRRKARAARAASCPTPTAVPPGCRFHPRCPRRFEPCDRVDPTLIPAGGHGAGGRLPAPRSSRSRGSAVEAAWLSRWREIAGPVGRIPTGPRNAITDVPGRPGRPRAGGERRAHRGDGGRAAVPAGARRGGDGQRHGRADREARDRRARADRDARSTCAGRTRSARSTRPRSIASGRGPDDVVLPVVGECDDGEMADSRTVVADDVERALDALGDEVAEGSVGAGTGMICFDFPGGIGTAVASGRRPPRRRPAALQLRRPRATSTCSGTRLEPAPERRARTRLLHRGLRDRRAARRPAAPAPGAAPAARPRARRLLRGRGLGGDRPRVLDRLGRRRLAAARSSTPTSPPRTRPRRRPSTTAWSRRGRPSASTARCRTASRSTPCRPGRRRRPRGGGEQPELACATR